MKKLILTLVLAAFALSPVLAAPAQAGAAHGKANSSLHAKIQKKKQQIKKLKAKEHKKHAGHKGKNK
jgi:Ni/Co efflux regulator RcnB